VSAAVERLKLTVAYDGRAFCGWQSQANGKGVQDHLETAFRAMCGERVIVHGSGRTDTGVHALAQIAHVDVPKGTHDLRTWLLAINDRLPHEVRIVRVQRAAADFHARFSAKGKRYVYRICPGPVLHPLEIGRAWHMPSPIDLDILRAGTKVLTGKHDFARFAANRGHASTDTVRTIRSIRLIRRGGILELHFEGDGFLYKMVRLLTGSLVRCAIGRASLDWLRALIDDEKTPKTHFLAPAEGLYLAKVLY
jgi:tRNA pseudouridine38-40 synthase